MHEDNDLPGWVPDAWIPLDSKDWGADYIRGFVEEVLQVRERTLDLRPNFLQCTTC